MMMGITRRSEFRSPARGVGVFAGLAEAGHHFVAARIAAL